MTASRHFLRLLYVITIVAAFAFIVLRSWNEAGSKEQDESGWREPLARHHIIEYALPAIAWLMSFPNSGTSYTLKFVRVVSKTTTASNYVREARDRAVPIYEGCGSCPMLHDHRMDLPERFILVKTHCLNSNRYAVRKGGKLERTQGDFELECLKPTRMVADEHGVTTQRKNIAYDPHLVKKAVHLVRNPLDNIVARFHLWQSSSRSKRVNVSNEQASPVLGFQRWCQYLNHQLSFTKDSHLIHDYSGVPCLSEFFLYVQWHNLAFETASKMGVETLVLHYEEFETNFNATASSLIGFLEIPRQAEPPEFVAGKTYTAYYTPDQRAAIYYFIKHHASQETWKELTGYQSLY